MRNDAVNIDDFKALAKRHMPRAVFDFIEGGVDDELGLARARAAFEQLSLVPRVGRDVSKISIAASLLGKRYSAPFGIAPTGLADLFRPGSDLALAKAAASRNIPFGLSAASSVSMEIVAPLLNTRLWCQIYGTRNREIMDNVARRAQKLGVDTLFVTLDVPIDARRERNLRNRFALPYKPSVAAIADALCHPRWLWEYWRSGGMPRLGNWVEYAPAGASASEIAAFFKQETPDPSQSWDDVKRLRDIWSGNLIVKGILDSEDAVIARQLGADGLVISTHGGRQLDRAPAPIRMVGKIRQAVGQDMAIILDGGIRRGSDIVCALAAGADFVLIGRSTLYGAIADLEAGVLKVIDILAGEVSATMTQLGCREISELDGRLLDKSF